MQILVYAFAAIIGLFVAWWVLKVSLGLFLSPETTARSYLFQLLRRAEINQVVPESCVKECVEESLRFARSYAKISGNQKQFRAELVKQLELQADMLRLWVCSETPFDALYQIHYKAMFERHGIPRLK